jgi:flagellar biosynthesis/type III secretory pathway M-ring protein FliF/YscJ
VTVNIATPDPAAFRRSEAQVTASLARAVARGQRAT